VRDETRLEIRKPSGELVRREMVKGSSLQRYYKADELVNRYPYCVGTLYAPDGSIDYRWGVSEEVTA
jgi:hypothetical protein